MDTSKCFIIGNGPSLKDVSNETLSKIPSFGSNGILLRFEPTYYVAVNPLAIDRFLPLIETAKCQKFLTHSDALCPHMLLRSMPTPLFSYDPLKFVYEGYTVTFVCLQLAFALGFTDVFLVGVDHRYAFVGAPNEPHILVGADCNHFDPTYFSGCWWNNPDLEASKEAYELARIAFENDGRHITNLTKDSALEVFDKGVLEDLVL